MKWIDLIEMCKAGVSEDISDTTNSFFKLYPAKLFVAGIQTDISRITECLEGTFNITTVASTELYSLPADFLKMKQVRYKDLYFMSELTQKPAIAPETTSQPVNWFVQGNKVGVYPISDTSSETIYTWYWRMTAPYALRLKHIGGGATGVTVAIEENVMTFVVTGGDNADTYTFTLTAAANDTLAELVAAINALAKLKLVVKATICDIQSGTAASTGLEEFSAKTIYQKNLCFFLEPEIPEEFQRTILFPALMYQLKMGDRETKIASMYKQEYLGALGDLYTRYKDRYKGSANLVIGGGNSVQANIQPLGTGGWVIVP